MKYLEKYLVSLVIAASVLASGAIAVSLTKSGAEDRASSQLSTFNSKYSLERFIESSTQHRNSYGTSESPNGVSKSPSTDNQIAYSGTNVQVAGVDELDTVKTDGSCIYVANSTGISIIKAYPPGQLSNVTFIDRTQLGSFVDDSMSVYFEGAFVLPGKLMVVCDVQETTYYSTGSPTSSYVLWRASMSWNLVSVFDIEDPAHPTLKYTAGVTGWSSAARLIGDTIYLVATDGFRYLDNQPVMPLTLKGSVKSEVPLSDIRYDPSMKDAQSYTNFLALNTGSGEENCVSVITGYSSTMYMSTESIFLTVQKWDGPMILADSGSMVPENNLGSTTIYKIAFNGLSMTAAASASVKGWVHDQFSLDEKDSYLRVATTTSWVNQSSAVFILDSDLHMVGSLDGIAKGERIFSARYVEDMLYIVTFRQTDPLFVIDLTIPSNPRIAGELTMPGFSTYLHPMDKDHLIGVGSLNGKAKISIYDVSVPSAPVETAKWVLEGYSSSYAIYDHKEVLYDGGLGLLVVPISAYNWSYNGSSVYKNSEFVFNVSADKGIELRGVIDLGQQNTYYYGLRRALYIGDYLYTISSSTIKVNLLSDLSAVASLIYDDSVSYWYYWRANI